MIAIFSSAWETNSLKHMSILTGGFNLFYFLDICIAIERGPLIDVQLDHQTVMGLTSIESHEITKWAMKNPLRYIETI